METIEDIKKLVEKIDGWLSNTEGELLYNLAEKCKGSGVIVEIGSWQGKSTIWLAKGSKRGNKIKVYAIDTHTGSSEHNKYGEVWTFEKFKKNISQAQVIDGAHEYELVKLDFELWFPKLIDGGIMAFHDTVGWPGPRRVVREFVYKSRNFKNIGLVGSITFAEKVNSISLGDKLRNRYILFLNYMADFAVKLRLPKPIIIIGQKLIKLIQ